MSELLRIRTPKKLVECLKQKQNVRFFIQLNYGGQSEKRIRYKPRDKTFAVLNKIDGTRQELTARQLASPRHSNIGPAMKAGAFYAQVA